MIGVGPVRLRAPNGNKIDTAGRPLPHETKHDLA